jgi:hypothetical protein
MLAAERRSLVLFSFFFRQERNPLDAQRSMRNLGTCLESSLANIVQGERRSSSARQRLHFHSSLSSCRNLDAYSNAECLWIGVQLHVDHVEG